MNKTGEIVQITRDGGYQSQNGFVNTFQMTIQCQDGTFTGQIGSKSQVYPMAVGQQINVEVTNTEHGVRFKKFNPQYAPQQATQNTPQGSQATAQATNAPKVDYEAKEERKQLSIRRGNALNAILSATTIPSDLIHDHLVAAMGWLDTGIWKVMPPNMQAKPVDNTPMPDDDEIPF